MKKPLGLVAFNAFAPKLRWEDGAHPRPYNPTGSVESNWERAAAAVAEEVRAEIVAKLREKADICRKMAEDARGRGDAGKCHVLYDEATGHDESASWIEAGCPS